MAGEPGPRGGCPHEPGEGGQRERLQQQLRTTEEEQDAIHDGFQAEHVGLQQQVIRGHQGRWEGQSHTNGEGHLSLAEVSLRTCQTQPGVTSKRPFPSLGGKVGGPRWPGEAEEAILRGDVRLYKAVKAEAWRSLELESFTPKGLLPVWLPFTGRWIFIGGKFLLIITITYNH